MIQPELAVRRFLIACLLGGGLGLLYGFLRPLRSRKGSFADGIFLLVTFYVWLYLSFSVCRGDLRLGYHAGLVLGGVLWEQSFGRWLRPVFLGFAFSF